MIKFNATLTPYIFGNIFIDYFNIIPDTSNMNNAYIEEEPLKKLNKCIEINEKDV